PLLFHLSEQFLNGFLKLLVAHVDEADYALGIEDVDRGPVRDVVGGLNRTIRAAAIPPGTPGKLLLLNDLFTLSRSSSELTPSRTNGLSTSFFTSDRPCGYMARQGPHQWPQKSSTTTLPR